VILAEAIKAYIDRLGSTPALSSHTIRSHDSDLRQFLKFCKNISLSTISAQTLHSYFDMMINEKRYAPATILRRWSTIKSFFNYCVDNSLVVRNPFDGVTLPVKAELQPPAVLTRGEIRRLLSASAKEVERLKAELERRRLEGTSTGTLEKNLRESIRNRAVIELLFSTGIRVGELVGLKKRDFNFNNKTVQISERKGGRRTRYFPSGTVKSVLLEYDESRSDYAGDDQGVFFINVSGGAIRPETVRKIVRKYAVSANIDKTVTPYTLRHTLASMLLASGSDIGAIQQILGTSSNVLVQLTESGSVRPVQPPPEDSQSPGKA